MKLLLLSLSLAVVLGQHGRHSSRYAGTFPDRYPDRYPGRYYPDPYPGQGNPYVRPSGCKNWCRRDKFYGGREEYYCCDHTAPVVYPRPPRPYPYPPQRQKICPPSPSFCTRTFGLASPPTECYSDSECSTVDRCCYDVCLKHKVCKTADYVEDSHRPRPRPYPSRPGPLGVVTGLVGSLFARSSFDEPKTFADDGSASHVQTLKDVKEKKH